ncbi:MAG: hypothetical protein K6G47_01400 [Clostridia bacterium]|nr:hypothetical protein [Clostridia bacterium]
MEKERKKRLLLIIIWLIIYPLLIAGTIYMFFSEGLNASTVGMAMFDVAMIFVTVFVISDYRKKYAEPAKFGEDYITNKDLKRDSVYGRKEGDMFDVLRNYKRKNTMKNIGVVIIVVIICFILSFIGPRYYAGIEIPVWAAALIAVALAGISFAISGRKDFGFTSVDEVRSEIQSKGYDQMRVNTDFMMGTYHAIGRGILVIGQSYFVVYCKDFCYVGRISDIKSVDYLRSRTTPKGQVVNGSFIRINENRVITLTSDRSSSEYILYEFRKLGLEVSME